MNIKKIDILLIFSVLIIVFPILALMVPIGEMHFMAVSGTSMEPTITEKDIIVIGPKSAGEIKPGDIISYKYNQNVIITHRVVKRVAGGFETQGDAYSEPDDYIVTSENIVGVMKLKIPYLGSLVYFAHTTKGIIILVVLPALLLIMQEIKELIKS